MLPVLICHLMFVHTLPCKDNANHTQNIKFFLNIMSRFAFYRKKLPKNKTLLPLTISPHIFRFSHRLFHHIVHKSALLALRLMPPNPAL